MAPALVTGNTIVLKPSVDSPINAVLFSEVVHSVGLPKGVFNVVHGSGADVGNELAANPKVGLISLTGSEPAGRKVMEAASQNITKVNLELGGKAPAIVFADADLDLAANAIVASRVINSGQVCNCAERVYVQREIKDAFVAKLVERMQKVRSGNPLEDETLDMGPMVNIQGLDLAQARVQAAVQAGGRVLTGGQGVVGSRVLWGVSFVNGVFFVALHGFHAGGRKSGIGGADGKHGLEEYLQTHVVYLQYDEKV